MAWAAVAGAATAGGINILGGLFGGKGEKRRAKEARAQEVQWREREFANTDRQFEWNKGIYDENKERYDPIFDEMRESMDDLQPDYQMIAGDINKGFDSAQGMERRNQQRYGISPTSGAAQERQRTYGIDRAAAHVGARSAGRIGVKEKKYARRADLFNTGQGIQSNNQGSVNAAMANQQNAARGAGISAGNEARYQDRRATADQQGWGNILGNVDWAGAFSQIKGWGSGSSGKTGGTAGGSNSYGGA